MIKIDLSILILPYFSPKIYVFLHANYVVDGEVEIWVESNFLSQEYLFTLAAEIAAQYPVGIIKPLDYSEKKEGEFAGGVSVRITCFIKSDKIEIEERIITNDRIIIVRGICPRQKLMPAGSKRGYYIIFKKNYR